jgi:predicted Zn-ribbon and HTH transcriptional regulator
MEQSVLVKLPAKPFVKPIMRMGLECQRCGHEWVPKVAGYEPAACPKCKSPYWKRPRRKPARQRSHKTPK